MNRRIELVGALAATLSVAACSIPTEAFTVEVSQREQFTPPGEYRIWWGDVEECSSTMGDFDVVRWYRAAQITNGDQTVQGLWEFPHDITLTREAEGIGSIVRHEILHDLLRGDTEHTLSAWTRCDLLREDHRIDRLGP